VFVANSGLVVGDRVLAARFRHPERRAEEPLHRRWFRDRGFTDVRTTRHVSEGEGDFAPCGDVLLAGFGFRTDRPAHGEAAAFFDRRVVSLELVDPRFYHLDTSLAVLGPGEIMYLPAAFSATSRGTLRRLFPDAIEATERDAAVMGLNAVSDGSHVVLPVEAVGLATRLRQRDFQPVPVEVSELRKAGGGVKCCTLELHR
jgi:N-dimethylarginine dimethylaminohydrolase